jgi:hypothetical protein
VECFEGLAELDLSYNRLSGTLPPRLAQATRLQEIKVEFNHNVSAGGTEVA